MSRESDLSKKPQEHRFPCASCGAQLAFAPGTEHLECQYCGHRNTIEASPESVEELDFRSYLLRLQDEVENEETELVKCDACAAELERPANLAAFACPFCGSNIVTEGGSTRRLIPPKSLLPFRLNANEARRAWLAWMGALWFAPNALKERARADHRFDGIYLPYWTYDALTESDYAGRRGDDYWVSETYTSRDANGNTQTHTRQVRRTRWRSVSGHVTVPFDDVLVTGSRALPVKYLEKLEPWDLEDLVPFEESYLSGFKAETYQIDLAEGFERARTIMDGVIRQAVCQDIGGDHQRISSLHTRHHDLTFKHILLPVWISAFRYGGKTYRMVVNARTGEVQGERPWSAWKIFFFVLAMIAIIATVIVLAQSS